jgi:Lrp/AsnC family transcriptional regulator for asnA, asnC and gidA
MISSRGPAPHHSDGGAFDEVDTAIVRCLAFDGRASYTDLARSVGLSQASVRARLVRMIDDGSVVITGRVDPRALGIGIVAIAFITGDGSAQALAGRIGSVREAVYVAATTGRFDLLVEVRCRNADHLLATLDDIREMEGVGTVESSTILKYIKQDWSRVGIGGVADGGANSVDEVGGISQGIELDDLDRRLVAALVADGRASYAELAPLVDLSQTAVRARVLRLLDEGIVTIQTHTSPAAAGIGGYSGIGIVADGPLRRLAARVAAMPGSTLVAAAAGRFDILVEAWWFDERHLLTQLDEIRTLEGVRSIESFNVLMVEKSDYSGGFAGLNDD